MSRKRWLYTLNGQPLPEPIEVSEGYEPEVRTGGHKSEEEVYGKLVATDGTDISTRRRHREYMQRNGLTVSEDYKEAWQKARAERIQHLTPEAGYDSAMRREQLGRVAYELEKKGRKR